MKTLAIIFSCYCCAQIQFRLYRLIMAVALSIADIVGLGLKSWCYIAQCPAGVALFTIGLGAGVVAVIGVVLAFLFGSVDCMAVLLIALCLSDNKKSWLKAPINCLNTKYAKFSG